MSSSSSSSVTPKRVVVLGGGYAGIDIVQRLLRDTSRLAGGLLFDVAEIVLAFVYIYCYTDLRITLVEPKDAFYHCVAAPRAAADADFGSTHAYWPYADALAGQPRVRHEQQVRIVSKPLLL